MSQDDVEAQDDDEAFARRAAQYLAEAPSHDFSSCNATGLTFQSDALGVELSAMLDPTDDPRMLGRLGGYEIAGLIGRGGMGWVLKGRDVSLDRFVAIKIMRSHHLASEQSRRRFAREAQTAASVVHDNVMPIYGVFEHRGSPYLVMPYIRAESLQHRIERTAPMPVETTLEIATQIARGLAAAHEQGLVHRDIKPSNILMPSSVSRVQITDFGLARAIDDTSVTQTGVIAGTPQYMSPEQARGEPVDGRTDQFSLGSVIVTMLTGRPPFGTSTTLATLRQVIEQPAEPLATARPDAPQSLNRIVDRLLQKDAGRRYESTDILAAELEDSLSQWRTQEPDGTPTTNQGLKKLLDDAAVGLLLGVLTIGLVVATACWPKVNDAIPKTQPTDSPAPAAWLEEPKGLRELEVDIRNLQESLSKPWHQ